MPEVIILTDLQYSPIKPPGTRPAGAQVLASILNEQGIETIVIDYFTHLKNFWDVLENVKTSDTKIVCISTTFLSAPKIYLGVDDRVASGNNNVINYQKNEKDEWQEIYDRSIYLWLENEKNASAFFSKVKSIIPDVKIVGGGTRAYRIYQLLKKSEFSQCAMTNFDYIILGPGDDELPKLCKKILGNYKNPFTTGERHSGVTFIKALKDKKPIPQIKFNKNSFISKEEWLPIEVSRGCGFNCAYCSFEKNTIHKKSKKDIIEEITRNYETWGTTGYQISADCLNDNRRFVEEFCDALSSLYFDIEYASYLRLDLFSKFPEHMNMLIKTGLKASFVGVETLNYEAGKTARRGLTPDKQKELLKELKTIGENHKGFWLSIYTIYGLPKETPESLDETNNWLYEQRFLDEVTTSVLEIYENQDDLNDVYLADMSTNPEKYGFKELRFIPDLYWKHETMDILTAQKKRDELLMLMSDHPYTRVGGSSLGEYSATRTLGFNHKQATIILKNRLGNIGKNLLPDVTKNRKKQLRSLVEKKISEKFSAYEEKLLSLK